jgi:cytochrome c-type biogenesis protein CcmH/NrfG
LKRLVELAPQDTDLRCRLARELVAASRFDEAIQVLRSIIALVPNHLEARKLLDMALHPKFSQQG